MLQTIMAIQAIRDPCYVDYNIDNGYEQQSKFDFYILFRYTS